MTTTRRQARTSAADRPVAEGRFIIAGQVDVQGRDASAGELPLRAFAFDASGVAIGSGDVDDNGGFNISANLKQPQDVTLVVGPAVDDLSMLKDADAPTLRFTERDWVKTETGLRLEAKALLPKRIWWPWRPIRVCVRGRVRKAQDDLPSCPVPFATVEVYDVDRDGCLWPILKPRLPLVFDKSVIKLPDLMQLKPIPPIDPVGPISRFDRVALNPQPLPPRAFIASNAQVIASSGALASGDPLPEPPSLAFKQFEDKLAATRVGELKTLSGDVAARLQDLTVTSRIPPWLIWPRCFYSRALTCTTQTNCDGEFRCCFWWWPFHVRNGRLRFDSRPDIIIKVTQVIDGVTRVIYLDPYTSTRWDAWGAYVDLVLNDEDIVCGSGCTPNPTGTTTHFVRIGNDEVFKIRQTTGLYDEMPFGGTLRNMAYGSALNIHAVFGDALSTPATQHHYRLSIEDRINGGGFKDIKSELWDARVHKVTHVSTDRRLGPNTINGVPNLFEVRDTATYNWYNQDWIGTWYTAFAGDLDTYVPDEGLFTLRLEVFDQNGVKLTSATVDYRDGTVAPPTVLPTMIDACDLVLQIDNKAPTVELAFPSSVNPCGVVPVSAAPFDFTAKINQENGRLHSWSLDYVKGQNIASGTLDHDSSDSGLAVPVNQVVSSAPMTAGLTGTCAFALTISAWAHIRNGYGLIYHDSQPYALAVDFCGG